MWEHEAIDVPANEEAPVLEREDMSELLMYRRMKKPLCENMSELLTRQRVTRPLCGSVKS